MPKKKKKARGLQSFKDTLSPKYDVSSARKRSYHQTNLTPEEYTKALKSWKKSRGETVSNPYKMYKADQRIRNRH